MCLAGRENAVLLKKLFLTNNKLKVLKSEVDKRVPSKVVMFLAWLLGGLFGFHRFYVRKYLSGLLMFATGGFLGVWWIADFFLLQKHHLERVTNIEFEVLDNISEIDFA